MRIKRIIPAVLAAMCISVSASAQKTFVKAYNDTKMSPWLYDQYQQQQQQQQTAPGRGGAPLRSQGQKKVRKYVLALVESTDGDATIRQKGGVVLQDFWDGVSAAFLPVDSLGVLDRCEHIMRMEANEPGRIMNDTSAIITGVDKAWAGQDALPQAFTGKGVYAGIMDVGFDFTHPAFRNDDGTSRIKWFWDPAAPDGTPDELGMTYTSPEMVLAARHTTDAALEDHGTHCMATMAGNGLDGRYVGMAPEADIIGSYTFIGGHHIPDVASANERLAEYLKDHLPDLQDLTDSSFELLGTDTWHILPLYRIFKQADAEGKPCVVSWSFGANLPFSDYSQDRMFLYRTILNRMLGPGHIVVAAAGNEGDFETYVKKEEGKIQEQDIYYLEEDLDYHFEIRTAIDTLDFTLSFTFEDGVDTVTFDMNEMVDSLIYYDYVSIQKNTNSDESSNEQDLQIDTNLIKVVVGRIFDDKPIFYAQITFPESYADTHSNKTGTILINTLKEVELCGVPYSLTFSPDNYFNSRGCHLSTIDYPANLERLIAVGAMHHRSSFTTVSGDTISSMWGSQEGHLVSFSGCGPTLDGGLIKPDVVAPGVNIISALNSFYPYYGHNIVYETEAFGRKYSMFPMDGTSMATPMVAGIIALWLQAKPDLTPEDILGVIERTSHQPEPEFSGTEKNNYYGYGEIDAYAGLLDILGLTTSVPGLSQHQPAGIMFRLEGQTLYIDGIDTDTLITVYDLNGHPVVNTTTSDGKIELPALPQGVYAVQIGKLGSTLIRLQ